MIVLPIKKQILQNNYRNLLFDSVVVFSIFVLFVLVISYWQESILYLSHLSAIFMVFNVVRCLSRNALCVRDCNVFMLDVVRDVCFGGLCVVEGFSLFKQANKLFFADQDI